MDMETLLRFRAKRRLEQAAKLLNDAAEDLETVATDAHDLRRMADEVEEGIDWFEEFAEPLELILG